MLCSGGAAARHCYYTVADSRRWRRRWCDEAAVAAAMAADTRLRGLAVGAGSRWLHLVLRRLVEGGAAETVAAPRLWCWGIVGGCSWAQDDRRKVQRGMTTAECGHQWASRSSSGPAQHVGASRVRAAIGRTGDGPERRWCRAVGGGCRGLEARRNGAGCVQLWQRRFGHGTPRRRWPAAVAAVVVGREASGGIGQVAGEESSGRRPLAAQGGGGHRV